MTKTYFKTNDGWVELKNPSTKGLAVLRKQCAIVAAKKRGRYPLFDYRGYPYLKTEEVAESNTEEATSTTQWEQLSFDI